MHIQNRFRTLAMASMLALAVVSVPVGQAHVHAQDNGHPTDNGVRCSFQNPRNGEWEFFLPGESITLTDGLGYSYTLRCGTDGNWGIESRATIPTSPAVSVIAPLPVSLASGA